MKEEQRDEGALNFQKLAIHFEAKVQTHQQHVVRMHAACLVLSGTGTSSTCKSAHLQVKLPKARKVARGGHEVGTAHQRAGAISLERERARANRLGQAVVRVAPVREVVAAKALPAAGSRSPIVLCALHGSHTQLLDCGVFF